jgi:hypothetical protein
MLSTLIGLLMATYGVAAGASGAATPTLQVYPKNLSVNHVGGQTTAAAEQTDKPPTSFVVQSGKQVALEVSLVNEQASAQKAVANFGVFCTNGTAADKNGPSITVTVPGDPSLQRGVRIMQRLKGTITVPSTCKHTQSTTDGYFFVKLSAPGASSSGAMLSVSQVVSATMPGPGLPAVGATGAMVLWRVVDGTELAAIKNAGSRYTLGPGQIGKYFYPTKAQAQALASKYESMGLGNYTVTTASIDDATMATAAVDSIAPAGEGAAWFFWEEAVTAIGEVAIVAE